jgi:hypothetical protein
MVHSNVRLASDKEFAVLHLVNGFRKKASLLHQQPSTRLTLEQLEDRQVLSVSYHGGALLTSVSIEPVYYGRDWHNATYLQQAANLNTFLGMIANSPYMDMLKEYQVGRGSLADSGVIDNGLAGGQWVDDTQVQQMLANDIAGGLVPPPTVNRLYMVYTAPNVVVTQGGDNSQQDFFGYHNAFLSGSGKPIYYAVIAHPVGNGDFGNLDDFETLTKTTSHELAESVTDPGGFTNFDPGGWFGTFPQLGPDQEIADVVNDSTHLATLNGYTVQGVWSQQQGMAVYPTNPGITPPSVAGPRPINLAAIANYFTHSYEHFADLIGFDYRHYLGRVPSTTELNSWVGGMQAGVSDEQVLSSFIGSPEYYQHTGGTDTTWVKAIYENLLNRTPSTQEVNGWLQTLASGSTRPQVALAFATSWEAESIVVQADYQTYLGRKASAAEVDGWVTTFQQGVANEMVVAGFVGSAEYFYNAKKGNDSETGWITSVYQDVLHRTPSNAEVNGWYQVLITF